MKTILRTLLASSLLTICVAAHADTLNGTTVSGTITGPTTPGFTTPTSSVGSTVEFTSAASNNFLYTADFNDTGVLFTVSCNSTVRGCAAIGVTDFTATFTDSAFLGGTFDSALASSIGIEDFNYSPTGSTLTITGKLGSIGSDALSFSPAPTPEPSSIALLGTGLLGVAGVARKKLMA